MMISPSNYEYGGTPTPTPTSPPTVHTYRAVTSSYQAYLINSPFLVPFFSFAMILIPSTPVSTSLFLLTSQTHGSLQSSLLSFDYFQVHTLSVGPLGGSSRYKVRSQGTTTQQSGNDIETTLSLPLRTASIISKSINMRPWSHMNADFVCGQSTAPRPTILLQLMRRATISILKSCSYHQDG